jgi:wyosine [tRNA(Phe)-imidazoG37] synthetase (radical SAM superfamily)
VSDASNDPGSAVFRDHRRDYRTFRYAYPVVSRRAGGLSIGVNLNPDKVCNFDCVYCQVDRSVPGGPRGVEVAVLETELDALLDDALGGQLWEQPRFAATPVELRRVRDFALSGDGEPTTEPRFGEAVDAILRRREARGLDEAQVVLITDASCLHHARVRRALERMDAHGGVVWAKLDAGTEGYYRRVNRTQVPFHRVLRNLAECAAARPVIVQSLFFRMRGAGPEPAEIEAYVDRLREIEAAGTVAEVHLYTIARRPAEPWCEALPPLELDAIAAQVRRGVRAPVRSFYG